MLDALDLAHGKTRCFGVQGAGAVLDCALAVGGAGRAAGAARALRSGHDGEEGLVQLALRVIEAATGTQAVEGPGRNNFV